jgi:formate hydrogenlyase subunit 6/NADH:ubiquinone oxidoreductase subunit I
MATRITDQCIACGLCEPECPNEAISGAGAVFEIDPGLCTECVGFHATEQCAAVCPVDVCVADPDFVEAEAELFDRALKLHPHHASSLELSPQTSHFRRAVSSEKSRGNRVRSKEARGR